MPCSCAPSAATAYFRRHPTAVGLKFFVLSGDLRSHGPAGRGTCRLMDDMGSMVTDVVVAPELNSLWGGILRECFRCLSSASCLRALKI